MSELTRAEVIAKAKDLGVKNPNKQSTANLIELIKAANVSETAQTTGNAVVVMSKLSSDLLFETPNGVKYCIKGMPVSTIVAMSGNRLPSGKFGQTKLPAEVWEFFKESYKDQPFIKNEIIYAESNTNRANDKATDLDEVKTGFEQKDPKEIPNIQESKEEE